MFLCSNSSAVGLWLSRLRKKSRKSFWTISYPPWVINLPGPGRRMRRSEWRELLPHPVRCETDSDHRRLLGSSISTPGKAPGVTSRQADPPPSSHPQPLPSPAPLGTLGPPGQWMLLVTEVPFFQVASSLRGVWPLPPPPPSPRARARFLPCLCRTREDVKRLMAPGRRETARFVREQ